MTTTTTEAQVPVAFHGLLRPYRYKCFYGGRGSGKSWTFATCLIAKAGQHPLRILCTRETMTSIRESVHQLLCDRIYALKLEKHFSIGTTSIKHRKGAEFIFAGLRHNVSAVRSLEGIDIAWVEEAANISHTSWEVLIPTIRKDNSEIWISFNPVLDTDATYERFVTKPPPDALVQFVSYQDNPWFPDVLRSEMEHLKKTDPDAYQHIWLGQCRVTLDGAIYAKELRQATEETRITQVPYDTTKPVSLYFDLGWADMTAIWFVQHIAGEVRCINYLEGSQRPFNDYLRELQQRPYVYGTMWLPHDAQAKSLGTGRSIEEIARAAGWKVRIVPKLSVADGINATRTLFANMWFDRDKCADGLRALRYYRYEVDPDTGQFSRNPLHDTASHGADALRGCAVAMKEAPKASYPRTPPPKTRTVTRGGKASVGWMRT